MRRLIRVVDAQDTQPIRALAEGVKIRVPYDTDIDNDGDTDMDDWYLAVADGKPCAA